MQVGTILGLPRKEMRDSSTEGRLISLEAGCYRHGSGVFQHCSEEPQERPVARAGAQSRRHLAERKLRPFFLLLISF